MTIPEAFALAIRQHQAGNLSAAEALYRQILAVAPEHLDSLSNLGLALAGQGRHGEAIEAFQRALHLKPDFYVVYFNLGHLHKELRHFDEAIAAYRQFLAVAPDSVELLNNLGVAFLDVGAGDDAILTYQKALGLSPQNPTLQVNLGCAYTREKRWEEASACFRGAIATDPDNADAHANLAQPYYELGNLDEALACCQKALRLNPHHAFARVNAATAWLRKGNFAETESAFRAAIQQDPGNAAAHTGLGMLLLLRGDYAPGWRELEWRWENRSAPEFQRRFSVPRWDGRAHPAETILIHSEQGFGDTIQFSRYVPMIAQRAAPAQVIFEVPPQLLRLFGESTGPSLHVVAAPYARSPQSLQPSHYLPLLSAPYVLGLHEPLSMTGAYLQTGAELRAFWHGKMERTAALRVGMVAGGSATHLHNRARSIPIRDLTSLFQVSGVRFYNLQVDAASAELQAFCSEGGIDLTAQIKDFADTAALLTQLDLIISVDTAVAHLAGALGKPVWTLLPFVPDWRWGLEGETTPWYPTMRLFRQPSPGDWNSVIQRVAEELRKFAEAHPPNGPVPPGGS